MGPDDHVCLCFHVTRRKLTSYLRVEKVVRASQLSQCQGAGSGCGWCVPFLEKLFNEAQSGAEAAFPTSDEYANGRKSHIQDSKGKPPG